MTQIKDDWKVGDQFTTPETGDTIFTVSKVLNNDVEARDSRSCAGYTVFWKPWITKATAPVENKEVPVEGKEPCNHTGLTDTGFGSFCEICNRHVYKNETSTIEADPCFSEGKEVKEESYEGEKIVNELESIKSYVKDHVNGLSSKIICKEIDRRIFNIQMK